MQFAGTDANIDTDPEHLSRLRQTREPKPGVYCIKTYPSGIYFDISRPCDRDVRIEDIAHALAMLCRFGGHVPLHFSVAQHSVLVAHLAIELGMPQEHYGAALLHDAHEAYLQDLTSPAKRRVGRVYTNLADDIQACVHCACGLPKLNAGVIGYIKDADRMALGLEQAAISRGDMVVEVSLSFEAGAPVQRWAPLSQVESKVSFLEHWERWQRECSSAVGGAPSAASVA